jgi:hypothetical protein
MMNGNVVLISRAAGCSVWVAPGTVGTCASDPKRCPGERPLVEELRRLRSVKELKPGPWARTGKERRTSETST